MSDEQPSEEEIKRAKEKLGISEDEPEEIEEDEQVEIESEEDFTITGEDITDEEPVIIAETVEEPEEVPEPVIEEPPKVEKMYSGRIPKPVEEVEEVEIEPPKHMTKWQKKRWEQGWRPEQE